MSGRTTHLHLSASGLAGLCLSLWMCLSMCSCAPPVSSSDEPSAEAEGEEHLVDDTCANLVACGVFPAVPECVRNVGALYDNATSVDDALCEQVVVDMEQYLRCLADGTCAGIETECEPLGDVVDSNPASADCMAGKVPATAPEGWLCVPTYYGGGDGCDCGCGVVDADCDASPAPEPLGCAEPGCDVDVCAYCYSEAAGGLLVCP